MKNIKTNQKVINDVYKNCRIAMQSISNLLPSTSKLKIHKELVNEYNEYDEFTHNVASFMQKKKMLRTDINKLKKAMLFCAVKMKTIFSVTDTKVAEMMIKGSSMGIISLIETRNRDDLQLDKDVIEFIDKLIEMESHFEERLKKFL